MSFERPQMTAATFEELWIMAYEAGLGDGLQMRPYAAEQRMPDDLPSGPLPHEVHAKWRPAADA
jgi:hypothetical protein